MREMLICYLVIYFVNDSSLSPVFLLPMTMVYVPATKNISLMTNTMVSSILLEICRYEFKASRRIPPDIKNTPIEIDLKPEASIPEPNFFVTDAMITPAATEANAAMKLPV